MLQPRSAPGWFIAYVVLAGFEVVGGFLDSPELRTFAKPLLMPLLLAFLVASLGGLQHPLATWVKRALVFSWVGDLLLMGDGDLFFILGIAAFLGAQICYIAGFRPFTALGPLRNKPWLAVPYVAVGVGLLVMLAPDLGVLFLPVTLYAAALVTMAVLAIGVSPATAAGAALFLVSDSLIALTGLSDLLPDAAGDAIMPTYVVGQLLIVLGVLQNLGRLARHGRSSVPGPA
jgi:uncharacterized membrane protein YhhN